MKTTQPVITLAGKLEFTEMNDLFRQIVGLVNGSIHRRCRIDLTSVTPTRRKDREN